MDPSRSASSADIALLLEGTFPYVSGGVGAWVSQIIQAFPEHTFAIVFLGGRREDYGAPHYELPANVVHFEAHYIHEPASLDSVRGVTGKQEVYERVAAMHEGLRTDKNKGAVGKLLRELIPLMTDNGDLSEQHFLHGKCSWDFITHQYEKYCTDPSFTDYFWTVRIMHKPIWQLVRICEKMIPAKIYHTVSTGYAGFLGALLQLRTNRPLLVSEHGIYTKERKIDLMQSQWIRDNRRMFEKDGSQASYFQEMWIRFFQAMGRLCYESASDIVALFEDNRQRQLSDGALKVKTHVIPNGISIAKFAPLRSQRPDEVPKVVALIGRVVPIKDIKTFIRAIFIASRKLPGLQGWIIGSEAEDSDYALECHELQESLGMHDGVKFLGFKKIDALLPQVGLVALTSVSEGLPLVVLEAFASGVPVVTTDVGSCRELIEGVDAADKALGVAGSVVQIANPEAFADAVVDLLSYPEKWHAAQTAGIARVERYYTDALMEESYSGLYRKLLAGPSEDIRPGIARC